VKTVSACESCHQIVPLGDLRRIPTMNGNYCFMCPDCDDALAQEMMQEAGERRPDSIDFMRDGDTTHYYDD